MEKYYDIDLNFGPTLGNDIPSLTGKNAINTSLKNIVLLTWKVFDTKFGFGLKRKLYNLADRFLLSNYQSHLKRKIEVKENRVERVRIDFELIDNDKTLIIDVYYTIKNQGSDVENFRYFMELIRT